MSLLTKYTEKEALLKKLSEELKALEENDQLKKELEFKDELEKLMREFDKNARDVIELLDPKPKQQAENNSEEKGQRRKRKLKIYKNPHTGETVETRGGNQKTLKSWKEGYGDEEVESWLVRTED